MPAFKPPAKFPGMDKLPGPLKGLAEFLYPQDSTQVPAIGMAEFPNKVPSLPTGNNLQDEVFDQVSKLASGRSKAMNELSELMPDYNPTPEIPKTGVIHSRPIGDSTMFDARVEPSAQSYFDRVTSNPEVQKWLEPFGFLHKYDPQTMRYISQGKPDESDSALQALMRFFAD